MDHQVPALVFEGAVESSTKALGNQLGVWSCCCHPQLSPGAGRGVLGAVPWFRDGRCGTKLTQVRAVKP